MDLEAFSALQNRERDAARQELAKFHGEERKRLEDKIEILNQRLANPEEALAQQQAIITQLEDRLAKQGNQIGGDRLAEANAALETFDYAKARELFEEISARTAPDVQTNADAAYALGLIAEAEIRWHDAYAHYNRAANLSDDTTHLVALARMAWRLGKSKEGERLCQRLADAAKAEHGAESAEFATQLNNLALVVKAQGRYAEAEALYTQALAIDRKTIGDAHPDFASRLNNLAEVLRAQGRLDEAAPLYAQSLHIAQTALGATHPNTQSIARNYLDLLETQSADALSGDITAKITALKALITP